MRAADVFAAGAVALLVLSSGIAAAREPTLGELTNFSLSPELSQWLVGPVSRIATDKEIEKYLALEDDVRAREFIDEFWQRRNSESTPWPDQQPRAVFERRAEEADRLYTEGVNLGRRTARGEVHVLYGPPAEKGYESDRAGRSGPVEIWEYGKKAKKGLDGRKPRRFYRFVKSGGVTVLLGSLDRPGRTRDKEFPD